MPKGYSNWDKRSARVAAIFFVIVGGQAASQTIDQQTAFDPGQNFIAPLDNDGPLGYYIAGTDEGADGQGSDAELCVWALNDWIRHSDGRLAAVPADEADAVIRVYFVSPAANLYGEMRPIRVGDRRGAEVYVRTDTDALGARIAVAGGRNALMRDTIVYLTCLHELGHALGMEHTAGFADVMYFFGFGGDIPRFFNRYRSRLQTRADIERESGLSAGDIGQLLAAYPDR
jgi:hypothetical protein